MKRLDLVVRCGGLSPSFVFYFGPIFVPIFCLFSCPSLACFWICPQLNLAYSQVLFLPKVYINLICPILKSCFCLTF